MNAAAVEQAQAPRTPRELVLREWTPWAGDLTLDEASRLARHADHVLDVDINRNGAIVLRPQSYVGRLRIDDFDVRIAPKVPVETVLAMLGEAFDLVDFKPNVRMGEHDSLEGLLVRAFIGEVDALLRQGLHRVYVEEEDVLPSLRGRVNVRATSDLFMRGAPRVACRFEEFTANNVENQVLTSALRAIAMNTAIQPQQRLVARRLEQDFVGVDPRTVDVAGIAALGRDVRSKHYRRGLSLAELVLRAMGFHERHGAWRSCGFLVDMNKLFETVLTQRLVQILSPLGFDVQRQMQTTLDVGGDVVVKPDIVIRSRNGRTVIVDAKYKTDAMPSNADLYQMVAYCRAMGVSDAILIDVAVGADRKLLVRDGVVTIHTMHVDLGSMASMSATVGRAAARIAAMPAFVL